MQTKTKISIATIVALLAVVGALAAVKAGQIGTLIRAGKSFAPPPESVSTAVVERAEWAGATSAIGTLVAVRGVVLGSELAGTVREIGFESGDSVRRGAVLVRLDISNEEAQLAAAKADARLARLTLQRTRGLREKGVSTEAELETAEARAQSADALVAGLQATIAKKTIRAPFDGRIAIRQIELGQMLAAGAPVASLQAVTPMYAEFALPQQALATLASGQRVRVRTDIFPGASWEGTVSTVNTEVDAATRNVRVRATVPNRDGRLRPGMFVNVEVLSSTRRSVLLVPATAVLFAPYGDSVFVVEAKKDAAGKASRTAHQRLVRLGERRGDFVEVQSGVGAGDTVVSAGAFKLQNGMAVVVNNALAPRAEIDPKPVD